MAKMAAGGWSKSVVNDFKHACALCIILAFFLVVFIDWDPNFAGALFSASKPARYEELSFTPQASGESDRSQTSHVESATIKTLIEDIQAKTREASGGVNYDLTTSERVDWIQQNPCRSRSELLPMYGRRKLVQQLSFSPVLDSVLAEYSKLHRACMLKVGSNVTEFFVHNKTVPGCKFVVGSPMYGTGLGNKIIVTISALLYAILTQRVLLVPSRTNLPKLLCEPFVGSSWELDSSTFPFPDGKKEYLPWEAPVPKSKEWTEDVRFLEDVDRCVDEKKLSTGSNGTELDSLKLPSLTYALSVTVRWQPANRFYCRTEQRMVDEVPWLYWGGCIYSVPKIFGSPVFSGFLGELFPDKMVTARMLRSAVMPGDAVFSKLVELDSEYFNPTDRRVGIQLRSKQGKEYYEKMNVTLNGRILDCVVENGILPNTNSSLDKSEDSTITASPDTKVFIASLYRELRDYLNAVYLNAHTITGENVEVVQVSSNEEQRLSVQEDIQAFVEILLLSLSDQLLVTPSSTFGSIAQGYGALVPWFIETREDTEDRVFGSCEHGQSVDTCHQYTETVYECPHDPSLDKKPIFEKEPSVQRCLDIDHDAGIQLISTFQSEF